MKIFGLEIRRTSLKKAAPLSRHTDNSINLWRPERMTVADMLSNDTVNACVGIISDAVASLPINVFRRDSQGGRKTDDSLALQRLLKYRPNRTQHTITFLKQVMTHLLLRGNAFIFLERDVQGRLSGLYALSPERMRIKKVDGLNEYYYEYTCDGVTYKLTRDTVLHIPAMVWDGAWGLSPIEYAARTARLGNSLDEYTEATFDGGIHSKLLVTVPKEERNFSEDDAQRLRKRLRDSYGGVDKAGDPMILSKGLTAQPLNLASNSDAQLSENRQYSAKAVAKIFRVPLSMLGESDAKYNNNEQQQRNFLQCTLNPWLRLIEQYFADLLPIYEREDCYVEFDRNAMLQADSTARTENYVRQLTNGQCSINDINRWENRPLVDASYGDVRFMPVNLAPMTKEYVDSYMAKQKAEALKNASGEIENEEG